MSALTLSHVAISLAGIASGSVVVGGLLTGRRLEGWTAVFLATTVATSVSGFLFPFQRFLPSHAFGVVSLVVLPVAIYAWRTRQRIGRGCLFEGLGRPRVAIRGAMRDGAVAAFDDLHALAAGDDDAHVAQARRLGHEEHHEDKYESSDSRGGHCFMAPRNAPAGRPR